MLNFKKGLHYFLVFIVIIKIIFLISAIGHLLLSQSSSDRAKQFDPQLVHLKDRTEFIFMISMAILLIYYFNPLFPHKPIDIESSFLFFLFACVIILTSDWNIFITEASWYKQFISYIS